MNKELIKYRLICDCGAIKWGKTQNIELVENDTIDHKCGGKYRYHKEETVIVESEPTLSKSAKKSKPDDIYPAAASEISEINLVAIKKIDAIFQCNKCSALIKIAGDDIEKAKKSTFPHSQCLKPEKGILKFLTVVGRAVPSSGRYTNDRIKKIENFVCNNCPYNPEGTKYKKDNPCQKPPERLMGCFLENIEYRSFRSGNTTRSDLQISDDVQDVIVVLGEEEKHISLRDIKRLFINRNDRYSVQDPDKPEKFPDIQEKLTDAILLKSLLGYITIGTRSIDPTTNKIKWICWDIDRKYNEKPRLIVDIIVKSLSEWYNLTGHVEKSGSAESYHIWLCLEPVDNDLAYEFDKLFQSKLIVELTSMGIETVADSIDRGVQKGEGAMIKLPFNIQLKNGVRSEFLADLSKIMPEKLPV